MGRQCDDGNACGLGIGFDALGGFPTVHLSQGNIHQNKVWHLFACETHAGRTIDGEADGEPLPREPPAQHVAIHLVVFHKQYLRHGIVPLRLLLHHRHAASCDVLGRGFDRMRSGGNTSVAVVPIPTSLSSLNVPPWISTIERTKVSPKPVPSWRRFKLLSACSKGWSTRSKSLFEIPIPESETEIENCVSSHCAVTEIEPPAGVNFTALPSRFRSICFSLR